VITSPTLQRLATASLLPLQVHQPLLPTASPLDAIAKGLNLRPLTMPNFELNPDFLQNCPIILSLYLCLIYVGLGALVVGVLEAGFRVGKLAMIAQIVQLLESEPTEFSRQMGRCWFAIY
jgi:hypothetical protein